MLHALIIIGGFVLVGLGCYGFWQGPQTQAARRHSAIHGQLVANIGPGPVAKRTEA
jgi:hypothetical protein